MNNEQFKGITGAMEGFELIVGPPNGVIENADIAVRWCVTPELVKILEDAGVDNPVVVMETSNRDGENAWRGIIPLGDLQTYARFYQAGDMKIFAAIVEGGTTPEERKSWERYYLSKDFGEYEWKLQLYGDLRKDARSKGVFVSTQSSVLIPEGVFGKEPSPAVKWYVNLWHNQHHSVEDQCEYRRRKISAFGIKWLPVSVYVMMYTVWSMLSIFMVWGGGFQSWFSNWKNMLHPFDGTIGGIFDSTEGKHQDLRDSRYVVWFNWKNIDRQQPIWTLAFLSPFVVSMFAVFSFIITVGNGAAWWYDMHVMTGVFVMVFMGVMAIVDLATFIVYAFHNYTNDRGGKPGKMMTGGLILIGICFAIYVITYTAPNWFNYSIWGIMSVVIIGAALNGKWKNTKNVTFSALDKMYIWIENLVAGGDINDYTEIRELLCPNDHENLSTDINMIPKERRTWRLRYKNFKAKVCKPMQR